MSGNCTRVSGNLLSFFFFWLDVAQGRMNGHPMRLELTRVGLLVYLANHYTTLGALVRGWVGCKELIAFIIKIFSLSLSFHFSLPFNLSFSLSIFFSRPYLSSLYPFRFFFLSLSYLSIVLSRWMIHREEWVLNISIPHQYPVLTDTFKTTLYNKLQTINKRIYKK